MKLIAMFTASLILILCNLGTAGAQESVTRNCPSIDRSAAASKMDSKDLISDGGLSMVAVEVNSEKIGGLKLGAVTDCGFWNSIGFRTGDVLIRADNDYVGSPMGMMIFLVGLKSPGSFKAQILRNGSLSEIEIQ